MANNVPIPGTGAATAATDDIGGVHYQRIKITDGTEDSTEAIKGDAANGLDVDVTRLPALATGSNTIGKVDQGTGGASAWKVDGSAVTQPISTVSLPLPAGAATEATLLKRSNAFATLINAQPTATTDEIRMDDITGGDLYIGRNADGASTSAATWDVVRIYRTATGTTTRIRYRSAIVWDNRTVGWT